MRRVAVVGYTPHRDQYPRDWEVVCFNDTWRFVEEYDRLYELHGPLTISTDPEHHEHLRETDKPVYCFYPQPNWRTAVELDADELLAFCPVGPYMTNTVSWVIAHLLSEGVDEIGLYGLDFATEKEFAHERPSVEYMLGVAHGMGVKVTIPRECDLLRCGVRYGLDDGETFIEAKLYAERNRLANYCRDWPDDSEAHAGALVVLDALIRNRYHQGDPIAPRGTNGHGTGSLDVVEKALAGVG